MNAIHRRTSQTSAITISNVAVAAQGDSNSIKSAIRNYLKQADKPLLKLGTKRDDEKAARKE